MHKGYRWAVPAAAFLLFLSIACAGKEHQIMTYRIEPDHFSKTGNGVFEGWGTSLCWWANRVGYSEALTRLAAKAFCDPENGLGLNILRYNIGGGDDPAHTHITRTDSMMEGFWKDPSYDASSGTYAWSYDWERDRNQRNVLGACLEAGGSGMLVEGFSNSPPYFMTESGCTSGAWEAASNNLREDAYSAFAQYLSDVAEHFEREWHMPFQSLSPMNEPDTDYWGALSWKQEGCHFEPGEAQSRLLISVKEELRRRGLEHVVLAGCDETSVDLQIHSLQVMSPEAMKALDRVDTHTYSGVQKRKLREMTQILGKNLWMSEVDGGETSGRRGTEMGAALWLAGQIADDLNRLQPSAWILWQAIDHHISSDGYLGRRDNGMPALRSGYWGTAVADHNTQQVILTMKYYALGQFTRYIRPGSRLIAMSDGAVAAENPEAGTMTIVAVNTQEDARKTVFDLTGMGSGYLEPCRVETVRTSGTLQEGEQWAQLGESRMENGIFETELKGESVTTFVIHANP